MDCFYGRYSVTVRLSRWCFFIGTETVQGIIKKNELYCYFPEYYNQKRVIGESLEDIGCWQGVDTELTGS